MKYAGYREKGIIGPADACVVAVNACKLNHARSELHVPNIVRAVYPVGFPQITIDKDTRKVVDRGYSYRDQLQRAKGGQVPVDIFLRDEYRPLSAALYSCSDHVNRPDRAGDDYVIVART